ncbi:hypothetical protein C4580_00920 [Candidatus Woesearchaeota archaeon]|nr:MAG: hypothetical protein C4580_00920 [Candidatus Woesearchaeota archaeon]
MKKAIIALIVIAALGGAYWYFIGTTPFAKHVDEQMSGGEVLRSGTFNEIDRIHKGSGTAKIVEENGQHFLVLENFQVTNGPDLFIGLSPNTDISSGDSVGDYILLEPLKGNSGNQIYPITKEQADNFNSAIIWCKRFGVLFSAAELA